jgi:enoyl-CoA hydratase/carnithine racemase
MEGTRFTRSQDGGVATVTLARPDRLNAMDGAFFTELRALFEALSDDGSVRAIVLAAEGRHFTAGLDLDWAAATLRPGRDPGRHAEQQRRFIAGLQAAFDAVEAARQPVIAAIHGGCIGGGVDLACACDLRVATADAWFQIAEVDVAIAADLGTLQRLPHLIPGGIVRELALTGRRMPADEAARWGLVNRVAADRDAALAAATDLAREIAAKSPMAVVGTKLSLNYSRGRTIADGLAQVGMWNAATLANADMAEVAGARAAKRAAVFDDLK